MKTLSRQSEPDDSSDLRELVRKCLIHNYEDQDFLSVTAVKRQLTRERICGWIETHPLHRTSDGDIRDLDYVDSIIKQARLLFATFVVAQTEHLMFAALSHELNDDALPCIDWTVLNLSDDERSRLKKYPGISSLVLKKRHYHDLPQTIVLPFKSKKQTDKFGAFGTILSVEIADGHLEGYDKSRVAEKRIRLELLRDGHDLPREVETLLKREHPNIVTLLSSYILTKMESETLMRSLHLIFPWAEMNLKEWMNNPKPPPWIQRLDESQRRACLYRYICGLVSGLSYLHRPCDGTITSHHDLKPENILVIEQELKIADFGKSHLRSLTEGSETENRHLGTYEYQPPEYWDHDGSRANLKHGRAFDVWSMGCIIIELLTLVVYGWESLMVAEFRNQRRNNPKKEIPILADKRGIDDSFHNNRNVVNRWIGQLQLEDASEKLKSTLTVAWRMIDETPRARLYSWEAELDLYNIERPDESRAKRMEKGALCIRSSQQPQRKILNGAWTPLHRAAQNGDSDRIIQLFEAGWSLYVQNHKGQTALDVYKKTQHRVLYENLCERLAPKLPGKNADERLVLAAKEGQVEKVINLLSEGVSPMSADKRGCSALCQVIHKANSSIIECLLQNNSKELLRQKEFDWKDSPLHRAVFHGHPAILKQILEYRPDIEDQQKQGKTALFLAAEHSQREAAQVLLDHGAQLFTLDNLKETPLHLAARRNRVRVLRTLLTANDTNKCLEHKNKLGETPLWIAVKHRHFEFAQILIDEGASVHIANNEKINLLEMVVKNNLLNFLSDNLRQFDRQDVEFRNWRDQTPLQIAKEMGLTMFALSLKELPKGNT